MAPMRAWWEEMEGDQLRRFFHNELGCAGEPPLTCEPYIAEAIVRQHLQWHNMWTVFPLQDLLATDLLLRRDNPSEERINVPAIPQYYWQYRLHLSLGQLLESKSFNEKLKNMLVASGRWTHITN